MDPSAKRQCLDKGKGLVLKLGADSLSISNDDMQRYPGSLIADLAQVNASSSSSSSSSDANIVDLEKLPNNPFSSIHGALSLTESLYRRGSLPVEALQCALAHIANSHSESSTTTTKSSSQLACTWDKAEEILYHKLTQLLSFLIIPGPVTRWLPDFRQLSLRQSRVMSFIFYCHAWEAAEVLLQFKPCTPDTNEMHGMYGAAAFLVTAECGGSGAPDVRVWSIAYSCHLTPVLETPHKVLADSLHKDVGKIPNFQFPALVRCTELPKAGTDADAADAAPTSDASVNIIRETEGRKAHLASALDNRFGRQFAKVLCKAAQEHGVTVGCIKCTFGQATNLPVWVVKW